MLKNLAFLVSTASFYREHDCCQFRQQGRFFQKGQIVNTPSIGLVGLTADENNKRVKVLRAEVFSSLKQVETCLNECVAASCDAKRILATSTARFTSRVIGQDLEPVRQFALPSGVVIREEARIETSFGLDVVYVGGNAAERLDRASLAAEKEISIAAAFPASPTPEPERVVFERLHNPVSAEDAAQLVEMYRLCFTSYLVSLDEVLVQTAAANSIFIVARDEAGRIIASAIGESLRVGPVTLLEVSEEAAHPILRVRGAASGCARRVIAEGKHILPSPVVAFWEARMWRNILGMGPRVGLTEFAGVLHQHCRIASPAERTSLPNKGEFGSLAVFYSR